MRYLKIEEVRRHPLVARGGPLHRRTVNEWITVGVKAGGRTYVRLAAERRGTRTLVVREDALARFVAAVTRRQARRRPAVA
jgi:hypothetical protein